MRHLWLPDWQIRPGRDNRFTRSQGLFAADEQPDVILMGGDGADMESLCRQERGTIDFEGRRYKKDVDAFLSAMESFMEPIVKVAGYNPRLVYIYGNHEQRIVRATEQDPMLDGLIGLEDLQVAHFGWQTVPFLKPITIGGVRYCHYFQSPQSLKGHPITGTAENRLNKLKCSHTMGHQQQLVYGVTYAGGRQLHTLTAGASYPHREKYLGPQGNDHWRGVVLKYSVKNGGYDPRFFNIYDLMKVYK